MTQTFRGTILHYVEATPNSPSKRVFCFQLWRQPAPKDKIDPLPVFYVDPDHELAECSIGRVVIARCKSYVVEVDVVTGGFVVEVRVF